MTVFWIAVLVALCFAVVSPLLLVFFVGKQKKGEYNSTSFKSTTTTVGWIHQPSDLE